MNIESNICEPFFFSCFTLRSYSYMKCEWKQQWEKDSTNKINFVANMFKSVQHLRFDISMGNQTFFLFNWFVYWDIHLKEMKEDKLSCRSREKNCHHICDSVFNLRIWVSFRYCRIIESNLNGRMEEKNIFFFIFGLFSPCWSHLHALNFSRIFILKHQQLCSISFDKTKGTRQKKWYQQIGEK